MTYGSAAEYRARAEATLASIAAVQAEIDDDLAATAGTDARREAEFARDARTGKLGVEWQRVQQRIDLGDTTLDDVMSGVDDSPAARALRERSQSKLTQLHDDLVVEDPDDPEEDPLAQMNQMQLDLAARLEALRAVTEGLDDIR